VFPAFKVKQEPKAPKGLKEHPVTKARRVTRARKATKATRAIQARAIKATGERKARRETRAFPSALCRLTVLWPVRRTKP
jgi:hypothetical protein